MRLESGDLMDRGELIGTARVLLRKAPAEPTDRDTVACIGAAIECLMEAQTTREERRIVQGFMVRLGYGKAAADSFVDGLVRERKARALAQRAGLMT